jgi:hypothetical protein
MEPRTGLRDELKTRCDALEGAYEFMLAYAAQGLSGDSAGQGGEIRSLLTRAAEALSGLGAVVNTIVEQDGLQPPETYRAFTATLQRDADTAATILRLALAQKSISSQLVDNVNASIHIRTLLTDLFVIDEILRPQPAAQSA